MFILRRSFSTTRRLRINPIFPIDNIISELESGGRRKKKDKADEAKLLIPNSSDDFKTKNKSISTLHGSGSDSVNGGGSSNNNGDNNKKDEDEDNHKKYSKSDKEDEEEQFNSWKSFFWKCFETSGITFASLFVLGVAGISYHRFYDYHVLSKISRSFDKGDELFDLTLHKKATRNEKDWVERPEQKLLDDIISGNITGRYFLLTGEKGCGKKSMVLNSMDKVNGVNCAFIDAHSDPEVFRIRLGKALKFEYHEDYIGSLFSIRGPRDTTALLDIERAFNKLEQVAIDRFRHTKKPLVLIINSLHLIKNDQEEGQKLIELLQQKAEELSGSGLVTMILLSDDYWLYERLKKLGTKLQVINIHDFSRKQAVQALAIARKKFYNENIDSKTANKVYDLIGGRAQHLFEASQKTDILKACNEIIDREKTWFLNQCGLLGDEMDDDVCDQGKFATSAMLLMEKFVTLYKNTHQIDEEDEHFDHKLPELPLWRARQIMNRHDFMQSYDRLNIFKIDVGHSYVRPDSVPMMRGFMEIAAHPGFKDLLDETIDRVEQIESLKRTRELTLKDLQKELQCSIHHSNNNDVTIQFKVESSEPKDSENSLPAKLQPTTKTAQRSLWKNRLRSYSASEER